MAYLDLANLSYEEILKILEEYLNDDIKLESKGEAINDKKYN